MAFNGSSAPKVHNPVVTQFVDYIDIALAMAADDRRRIKPVKHTSNADIFSFGKTGFASYNWHDDRIVRREWAPNKLLVEQVFIFA